MVFRFLSIAAAASAFLTQLSGQNFSPVNGVSQEKKIHLTRDNPANPGPSGLQPATAGNGITYHGGPVILGTTNVYYIFYGNWAGSTGPTILQNFASNIGGSEYFNINTTYYD